MVWGVIDKHLTVAAVEMQCEACAVVESEGQRHAQMRVASAVSGTPSHLVAQAIAALHDEEAAVAVGWQGVRGLCLEGCGVCHAAVAVELACVTVGGVVEVGENGNW